MKKQYNCEIISVGTELLLGNVVNTNARDLSEMLSQIGINVIFHTVVGDNSVRLRQCIETAKNRADIIVTTGGLGPTCDDLTKQTVAEAFGIELICAEEEMQHIYNVESVHGKITENNFLQALVPEGGTVFHNNWGTAPGCGIEKDGKIIIMVPGVPTECINMFREQAIPFLQKYSSDVIVSHTINTFGITESAMDDMFAGEMSAMTNPSMAPYAKGGNCFLRITAKAANKDAAEQMLAPVLEDVKKRLGDLVYGIDVLNMEQRAAELLNRAGLSFSIIDCCTGGAVIKRLNDMPKGFASFRGAKLLNLHNGQREAETAKVLAMECMNEYLSDIGIGICGTLGEPDKNISKTVHIVLTDGEAFLANNIEFDSWHENTYARHVVGNYVFNLIIRYIRQRFTEL